MTLYDKNGKAYEVPHSIDVKEWLRNGFSKEKPVKKRAAAKVSDIIEEEKA